MIRNVIYKLNWTLHVFQCRIGTRELFGYRIITIPHPPQLTLLALYNFASVFNRGTSFWVNIIFPVIFSLPFMNATCGFNLPRAISTMSASATWIVVSAFTPCGAPSYTLPLFRSKVHSLATLPLSVILYANTAFTDLALAGSAATRSYNKRLTKYVSQRNCSITRLH